MQFPKHPFRTHGGAHVPHRKHTAQMESVVMPPPDQVVIPMSQHIGASCTPVVKAGDLVKVGQLIGDSDKFVSAPIHASVSGKVSKITTVLMPSGMEVQAVVIDSDGEMTPWEDLEPPKVETHQELVKAARASGLVGLGGAGFPAHIKLNVPEGRKIDTLIINVAECEPYITADHREALENGRNVLEGVYHVKEILGVQRVIIAVEDNKSEAIAILRRHLPDWPGVELAVLPTRYPQGAEKQLIQAVTGRQVPPGHLPFSVGCAVFNAGTVAAVYRAVYEGKPVTKRIVTVTGEGVKEPKNLIVRIGTPFAQVIEAAGGLTEDACKVLSGGPMMGTAQGELAAPVLKGTNAVLCLTSANPTPERPVCIRCSKCVEVCPMHLQPLYLYRYEAAGNLDALQALHVTDCIECGCCSYTCPGQLPLTERFRAAKQALKEGIRP